MRLLADIIVSMIQAMIFAYSTECCLKNENKLNKFKVVLITIVTFIINSSFTSIFGNISICVFIIHISCLIVMIFSYKDNKLKSMIPYTLTYSFMGAYGIISYNLFFGFIEGFIPVEYADIANILIIYVPYILFLYLCIKYMDKFIEMYKLAVSEKINMIVIITISFCLDFVLAFYLIIYNDESKMLKNMIITILCIFLAFIIKYFANIKKKSDQIFKLNEALEEKNSELRKIKHDYGAQISYLYGLCLMERFDDLKKSLKDIINKNDSTPTAVEVSENRNSILSLALKPAIDMGIHVIIEENCDFSLVSITEMEFYRIVSNIVNNAIKAMNGKGIIIAKAYEYLGNVIVRIENNGPRIPEQHLNDIFKVGFTTKENSDQSHGYGLSIVKDLVESHNGKIYVKSSDVVTEFKIVFPIKNFV
ncbi:sensor histidine kinase [Clostridium beijerinckii]|uniref:histidine kinase n=1 Tax=Clostridium beijerinckii TaxID=1520 RepID=A0A1S8S6Q4_CLOBE|nr:ATP-binding protein [Clostridium beijerinckii]OOM61138.1 putative sensor histidine kinase TcrY [Clostridium beijerinckii]